jgi:hypothetical protein
MNEKKAIAAIKDAEPEQAPEKAPEKAPTVREIVAQHLSAAVADPKQALEHPTFAQYAEERGLEPWKRAACLARFKADGFTEAARMPYVIHDQALHEALHGRI